MAESYLLSHSERLANYREFFSDPKEIQTMTEQQDVAVAPAPVDLREVIRGGAANMTMQILLDDALFERVSKVAEMMSKAQGVTPPHLIGQPEACFAVVTRSLTWNLDPFAVAQATYQVGGKVAYEGKLVQAILEQSGRIEGPIKKEFIGPWEKIVGKFEIKTGVAKQGRPAAKYPAATWKKEDEEGLGIIVTATVRGETEPRAFKFDLKQAFPRNSTLWATDPQTQLSYVAVRRFASVAVPSLMFGVPFADDDPGAGAMIDITPDEPLRDEFTPVEGMPERDSPVPVGHQDLDQKFAATMADTETQDTAGADGHNQAPAVVEDGSVVDAKPAVDDPPSENVAGTEQQPQQSLDGPAAVEWKRIELPPLGTSPDREKWTAWVKAVVNNVKVLSVRELGDFHRDRASALHALDKFDAELYVLVDRALHDRIAELA